MAWPWRYAIRVDGLGDTGILFLPNAGNDVDARSEIEISDRIDRRRHTLALYHIACIIDERTGKDENELDAIRGRAGRYTYIITGTDRDKKMRDSFFVAESVSAAIKNARSREWLSIRLYQCKEIPLT